MTTPSPTTIHGLFVQVLDLQSMWSANNTPEMQSRGRLIRNELPQALTTAIAGVAHGSHIEVAGGDGAGSKTRVPWVRLFDPEHSPKATAGWYLVFLFAADGSACYLSLNQGTSRAGYGGTYRAKPMEEIAAATSAARKALAKSTLTDWSTDLHLADPGAPGKAYEAGSVFCRRYDRETALTDAEIVADISEALEALAVLQAALPVTTTAAASDSKAVATAPSLADVAAFVAWMRDKYGPTLVPTRRAAEDAARALLDAHAGAMTVDQARDLGQLLNTGDWNGTPHHNRFSPAFVGASLSSLIEPIEQFNQWTLKLWASPEPDALQALAALTADRKLFPGAGTSYPSAVLYLRDRSKYAVRLKSTESGLNALGRGPSPADGPVDYQAFCDAVTAFREEFNLEPQEVDAILAEASRQEQAATAVAVLVAQEHSKIAPGDPLTEAAAATYLNASVLEEWLELLTGTGKRQLVFYGPPGTGKTHIARHLASLLAGSDGVVETVQFHPSFSYEDFIEGLRPKIDPDTKQLSYDVAPGVLKQFCTDVVRKTEAPCVLVIDELNRADLGSVLGEVMTLLEYRERGMRLPYSKQNFSLPENLYVLATMNTADRSLALVDFALRRRFHAVNLQPDRIILQRYLTAREESAPGLLEFFDLVQERVADRDFAPGHSFWMTDDLSAASLERVWRYELTPYLAEYWADSPAQLDALSGEVAALLGENT